MQTIYELILKRFLASSIAQIGVIGLTLIVAIFLLNEYQADKNRQELERITEKTFQDISGRTAENIRLIFDKAFLISTQIQASAKELFYMKEPFGNSYLELIQEGPYFRNDWDGLSTVYSTHVHSLDEHRHNVMERLSILVPSLRSSVQQENDLISSAWINIDKYFAARFPPFDVSENVPSNLDVTQYRFYYAADPEHNPEKKSVFLDLYKESWSLPLGEIGVFLSPIYTDGEFIGVLGLNLTVQGVAESLLAMELPHRSYLMLLDDQDILIASSDESRNFEEFGVHSFYHHCQNNPNGNVKIPIDSKLQINQINKADKIVYEQDIPMTNLKIRLCANRSDVFHTIDEVYMEGRQIGLILIGFILLVSLLFYGLLFKLTKRLALYISAPLNSIVQFSRSLGTSASLSLEQSDISEFTTLNDNLLAANKRLSEMLIKDGTTGLYNHQKLYFDLEKTQGGVLVLFCIDYFKRVNSVYGSAGGDALLRFVAEKLMQIGCDKMRVYRTGGDTFGIYLSRPDALDEVFIDKLLAEQQIDHFEYNGIEADFSYSCGATRHDQEPARTIKEAEIALDEAKKTRRGSCVIYSDSLQTSKDFEANLIWGKRVKEALANDALFPVFQPIFNTHSQKIEKFESLVRMRYEGEVVPPYKFLESARNTGLLNHITRLMITKTFAAASRFSDMEFSINISFSDFADDSMFDYIEEQSQNHAIQNGRIVFEVLETEALVSDEEKSNIFVRLKEMGYKVAIDDFGTGHSNFSHLLRIKADYIKIDGQFIKNLENDPNSRTISKTIIDFAHSIEARTIAEFVSGATVAEIISGMGIDYLQGYHIAPPMPEEELGDFLASFTGI